MSPSWGSLRGSEWLSSQGGVKKRKEGVRRTLAWRGAAPAGSEAQGHRLSSGFRHPSLSWRETPGHAEAGLPAGPRRDPGAGGGLGRAVVRWQVGPAPQKLWKQPQD